MARKRLGEILMQAGVLDQAGLRAALSEQRRWGGHLGRILIDMKMVTEDALVQALSHQLNFPVVNISETDIAPEVLDLVPADLAERYAIIPFNLDGKFLDVAMSDPTNLGVIDELRIRTQLNVRSYLAGPKAIERALARYYGRGHAGLPYDVSNPRSRQNASAEHFPASVDVIELDTSGGRQQAPPTPSASAMRARGIELSQPPRHSPETSPGTIRDAEVATLQARIQKLEQLVERDENVLRKLLVMLIEKGVCTREEILERIK